ncbi:aminoglycoside 6-adenylyltransferase [Paenibacillus cisolokensis]|uniref:aminoglycoside 6-adenylyltransferase n=1 Tax=Paenibacillus cisolokensis TaxID=1658519 RepID=UPI003D289D68
MRSEREMLDAIVGFAREDERIRAVIMNGSRANPDAPRDRFQDYDIVYAVTDVGAFVRDRSWIGRFGDVLIMQTPDDSRLFPPSEDRNRFAYLMLFQDGDRIDLTFYPADRLREMAPDSLSLLLLDKDGAVGELPPPSNRDYLPKPPTAGQFADCCNEFWWVATYVAKGLWRGELSYAKYHADGPVRDMLHLMLNWHIGVRTGFTADPGKLGKYYKRLLEPERWKAFTATYADADEEKMWRALFAMCDLFRDTSQAVASHFGYRYPAEEDENVTGYLRRVKAMPRSS